MLQNSAGTGRQLAKDGCAVMDHQMRSYLHPQAGGLTHGLSRHSGLSDSHLRVPHTLSKEVPKDQLFQSQDPELHQSHPGRHNMPAGGKSLCSSATSALQRPWQRELERSQKHDKGRQAQGMCGMCRGQYGDTTASSKETEAEQCLDRVFTDFLSLWEPSLSPNPRPRRSEALSWDRLLSITADGVLEVTHQISELYSAR